MYTIYDFVKNEINRYNKPITIEDGWDWSMKEHIRRSFLYLNSQFEENNSDRYLRPNKNIVLAMMNVQYRTEGFDVKDIELFVDNPENHYKSDLTRKYHDKWALDNQIDTFIDELVESYVTYGGALIKNVGKKKPMVTDLRTIAFCNQKNILKNPFGFLHKLSQSELREMKQYGWGKDEKGATIDIDSLINLVKKESGDGIVDEIEVYEVYGVLPSEWLADEFHEVDLDKQDVLQMQVIAYYKDENSQLRGVTLYKNEVPELNKIFKLLKRDNIKQRALGRGGVEELFEAQIWTNWNEIKLTEMLEASSKTFFKTTDPSIASKHPSGLKGMDNLEIIELTANSDISQIDTFPKSLEKFNDSLVRWEEHGQRLANAQDNLMGEAPSSGTPFKLFEAQTIEGKGMHHYRQGKIATFVDEVYRDWILPHISKEILKDTTFLAELSSDEMIEISQKIAENKANSIVVEKVLNGDVLMPGEVEQIKIEAQNKFIKSGNKKFIKFLKDEFKDEKLAVRTNIAGKQKNLALLTDKLVNVMKQYIATPQVREDPAMSKLLNTILESSGLSPIMFNPTPMQIAQPQPAQAGNTQGLEGLAQATQQNAGNTQR